MVSRNRSTSSVKPYIRATCNPDADSWVADFLAWWIHPVMILHPRSIGAGAGRGFPRRCSRSGPAKRYPLQRTPRAVGRCGSSLGRRAAGPDQPAVLADLAPELYGLPLGIPAGVLGEGEEHGDGDRDLAPSWKRWQKKLASWQNTPISEISLTDRPRRQRLRDTRAPAYPGAALCHSPRVY